MKEDFSYGIIPLRQRSGKWETLMVQLHAGHWGFPKGHPEVGEEPIVAAQRELCEETGLHLNKRLTEKTFEEEYYFREKNVLIHKKVIYFIALVKGHCQRQKKEVKALKWVALKDAEALATYPATKALCQKTLELIEKEL